MNFNKIRYDIINIFIFLMSLILICINYKDISTLFRLTSIYNIMVILVTVLFVHGLKAIRLYFTLYDSRIGFVNYLKVFCKVTPISLILPYKLGDFFRIYCYGNIIKDYPKAFIIVLIDRFMDTLGLLIMIILMFAFNDMSIPKIALVLLIFLCTLLLLLIAYPGVHKFWRKKLLSSRATERKYNFLKLLDYTNSLYVEIKNVCSGKGVIIFFLSLFAWIIEIWSITLKSNEGINIVISNYLSAAVGIGNSNELRIFVFVSICIMILIYLISKGVSLMNNGRK